MTDGDAGELLESARGEGSSGGPTQRTVMFLDLCRFTSLNDAHGDTTAIEVIDRFSDAVHASLIDRGRVVKTLGDGVLLELISPGAAIAVADEVTRALHAAVDMPELAGGISTGPVIERDGDVLGATVNLASRLAGLAPAGELRVTGPAAHAAADGGWQVEPLGPVPVRGFHDLLDLFAVVLCPTDHCVVDPVCGMRISPGATTPTVPRDGKAPSFCSPGCADRFLEAPEQYLHEEAQP
ncbi:YHS domain-containing protein [Actinomarinicola tropica]|uniref:YHS domain-containing protein n=1 Tax=Actinomarinicola tropica TaxID=2789776 RepID=UPI001897A83D|nr:YHS domain-containing protein [Actinomarinicola tropica]